jgi:hypothetical protein
MVTGAALVVLVDEETAAGAEVVAGALKDLDRAVVLGRRTAGIGRVQVVYEFGGASGPADAMLKLTIATYRDPRRTHSGRGHRRRPRPDGSVAVQRASAVAVPSPSDSPEARIPSAERPLAELPWTQPGPTVAGSPDGVPLEDVEVRLARDILVRSNSSRRSDLLAAARALLSERR